MDCAVAGSETRARTCRPCAKRFAATRWPTSLVASDTSTTPVDFEEVEAGIAVVVGGAERMATGRIEDDCFVDESLPPRTVLTALKGNSTAERRTCPGEGGGLKKRTVRTKRRTSQGWRSDDVLPPLPGDGLDSALAVRLRRWCCGRAVLPIGTNIGKG